MNKKFIVPAFVETSEGPVFLDGSLFKLPPDLGGASKTRQYMSITKLGWSKIDFGYWVFVHKSNELGTVRFVGLSLTDTQPTKILGPRQPFSKQDFERYIESLVEGEQETKLRVKEELSLLIHDLRRFSNSIYQNAVATKKAIFEGESEEAATRIQNTLAAQAMLSIRTDILDLAESGDVQLDTENVPVYRKFDKVVKSFQPGCTLKGIEISITGSSHSLVSGPDCIEIIAYILADNALKYSPDNHKISVAAKEQNTRLIVTVTSLGPLISPDEEEKVFEKGFRSHAAQRLEASGTGFGLFLAKSLVERFDGKISVRQFGDKISTNRGEYRDTEFKVEFPISEKRERPVHTHVERKGPPKQLPARSAKKKSQQKRRRSKSKRIAKVPTK